ncbi:MAG: PA2169 family four-helix-bundle protein [Chloroflexi bacterium]|nr:PA2169 family four-helix-bundle protein [Chloroflexota bacterium]MCC6895832.1 PA2169 family four-helix-bundle protein [Anaerolineae bacterium]
MNSFLNPLMNPALGGLPVANAELTQHVEGRTGEIWSYGNLFDSLQHLIRICHEGEESYRQAAEHTQNEWLRGQFENYSKQRQQFAVELSNIAAGYGAEPQVGTTVGEALRQAWTDLRTALTGASNDDKVLLEELERSEDTAKAAYEEQLDKGLPEHVHNVVQNQYQDILRGHNQVRDLRDGFPNS